MKKKFQGITLVVLIVMAICIVTACTKKNDVTSNPSGDVKNATDSKTEDNVSIKKIKIGFLAMNRSMTWMQYALKSAQAAADEEGIELVIYDAENEVAKQTTMMEDLVSLKVDAIITDPINVESLSAAVVEADSAGIPVTTFDRRCEGAPYLAFVGCDDVLGGRLAAQFIAEKLGGKGKVVELVGAAGASPTIDRGNGFHDEMKKYPDIEIVYSQTGEFTSEKGMSVMEDAIVAVGDFDAVFSHNDDMMIGALQAMKDAKLDLDKIITISYDGVPDALSLIRSGEHDATIQYPSAQAGLALKKAVEFIRTGETPELKDELIEPWIITIDNLDTGDFYSELPKE